MSTKSKILGLDIGATSIGWCLLELPTQENSLSEEKSIYPEAKIIKCDVRIFPAGKENFGTSKEKSLCEGRRIARGMRRRYRRLSDRKRELKDLFKQLGIQTHKFENDNLDPYLLRKKGLDEPLSPTEFARCLFQICRKRGFWSNRKDSTKEKENSDMLQGAHQLEERLSLSGARTVGEYFARLRQNDPKKQIRNKSAQFQHLVLRQLLKNEFELLWKAQEKLHENDAFWKESFNEQTKPQIFNLIFFQRPIYWRKSVIGYCEWEPDQLRAPRADRRAQEFRILQELNNLAWIEEDTGSEVFLSNKPDLWKKLYEKLMHSKEISFDAIQKLFNFTEKVSFNLEKNGRNKLKGMETDAILAGKNYFGKEWQNKSESEKNEIVRILLDRTATPDGLSSASESDIEQTMSDDQLIEYLTQKWNIENEIAKKLAEISFPAGYGRLSVKALEKLLPPLRQGKVYMGKDINDSAIHEAGYVRRDEKSRPAADFIPIVSLRTSNPVVNRILSESRRLINDIIKVYGKPDIIRIELSREAKQNKQKRDEYRKKQEANKKERELAENALKENGVPVSFDAILRYRLWEQQRHVCIYSGDVISFEQLFNGSVDIDHIYPLSRSMDDSQNNKAVCFREENIAKGQQTPAEWLKIRNPEKFEKVVHRAHSLPYLKRIRFSSESIPEDFTSRQLNDTKFASRALLQMVEQLYPTDGRRYVYATNGAYTSLLRHQWGLNSILNNQEDFLPPEMENAEKNRNDHRHHAIDALVIALTSGKLLSALTRYLQSQNYGNNQRLRIPYPWDSFRQDVAGKINQVIVSHKPCRRARGKLHEDSIYGPVYLNDGSRDENNYVIRKNLIDLSQKEVNQIRDNAIRRLVQKRVIEALTNRNCKTKQKNCKTGVEAFEITNKEFSEVMKSCFSGENVLRFDQSAPNSTPIIRVRILVPHQATIPLRQTKNEGKNKVFIRPGNTHHIEVFERINEKGKTVRELVFCTLLEARERILLQHRAMCNQKRELENATDLSPEQKKEILAKRRSQAMKDDPIIRHFHPQFPQAKFLFSISSRDSFIVNHKGKEKIVKFLTGASTSEQLFFRDNRDASNEKNLRFSVNINDIIKKINIDSLGNLSQSHE